jgi:hypothetical protein
MRQNCEAADFIQLFELRQGETCHLDLLDGQEMLDGFLAIVAIVIALIALHMAPRVRRMGIP